jgi:hypothetical protein
VPWSQMIDSRWAPRTVAGLLLAIAGLGALLITAQAIGGTITTDGQRAVTVAAGAVVVIVAGHLSRLVRPGPSRLRRHVRRRRASLIYGAAISSTLITVLVHEAWLTVLSGVGLAVLAAWTVTTSRTDHQSFDAAD